MDYFLLIEYEFDEQNRYLIKMLVRMDIKSEKLLLIEQLTKSQDIDVIMKIKKILCLSKEETVLGYNPDGTEITENDLISRAEESNKAIKENRTENIDQVRENMKNW